MSFRCSGLRLALRTFPLRGRAEFFQRLIFLSAHVVIFRQRKVTYVLRNETTAGGIVTRTYEIVARDRRLSASVIMLPNGQIEQFIVRDAAGS